MNKADIFKNSNIAYDINKKNKANGLDLLASMKDEIVATAFFDPQYRGVLDKLKYGNEGKQRGKARCELTQMNEDTIKEESIGEYKLNQLIKGFYP